MDGRPLPAEVPVARNASQTSAPPQSHGGTGPCLPALLSPLPFTEGDLTAGCEHELQAAVFGTRDSVDLPLVIQQSNFYRNLCKRVERGDAPRSALSKLEHLLEDAGPQGWDNSWVRFPLAFLNEEARATLRADLRADKSDAASPPRGDERSFFVEREDGDHWVRVPVSYLLKLSLAQIAGGDDDLPAGLRAAVRDLQQHYLSDNSSPELTSFRVVPLRASRGLGRALGTEAAKRLLLTYLLAEYANDEFRLRALGQDASVHQSASPSARQREINEAVTDSFYRELYMSPCLSGWERGEEKLEYMRLCHQVLTWSQLCATVKLRDAGIVANNLMVPPSLSTLSLANNGVHITIGSRRLSAMGRAGHPDWTPAAEKRVGDLVTKVVEHFMPLFPGVFSAAPRRIDFRQFHPELVLGYLPHELDYSHLRPLWRRWRRKADIKFLGATITPFGPRWIDAAAGTLLGLRGDFVPDARLLEYLVSPLSTPESPALDGSEGNWDRLKSDLADHGVFHKRLSLYLMFRQRFAKQHGFCGYEGRAHSLFPRFSDLGDAASLQALLCAHATRLVATGAVAHADIPDTPEAESERRQFFFAGAIGLKSLNTRPEAGNRFLAGLLSRAADAKPSRRYPDRMKVKLAGYRRALVASLREDSADLVEQLGLGGMLDGLERRLDPATGEGAAEQLTRGILAVAGARTPMALSAREFDEAAEQHALGLLRAAHLAEGLESLRADLALAASHGHPAAAAAGEWPALCREAESAFARGSRLDPRLVRRLLAATVASIAADAELDHLPEANDAAPVH
ncbi:MAG: hypothetical protein SF028_11315 [Candidatus Sumerlaeia bacterium]|nr:hypothetical protein [Candidatus Sumerlaeia bacterium]